MLSSLRRRTLIACTTARNGSSNTAEAASAGRIGGAACDWATSLNSLQNQLSNCALVNLYVAWYGNDLRAGSCTLVPGVTRTGSGDMPHEWECNGLRRNEAHLVSTVNGNAAFGGTPDDRSVVAAIQDLKGRGLEVCFTPFILMDIPDGNTLPDPYGGRHGAGGLSVARPYYERLRHRG